MAKDKLTFSQTTGGIPRPDRLRAASRLALPGRSRSSSSPRPAAISGWTRSAPGKATLETAPESRLPLSEGRFGTILRFPASAKRGPLSPFSLSIRIPATNSSARARPCPPPTSRPWTGSPPTASSPRTASCSGMVPRSGRSVPARSVPEWKWVPDYAAYLAENPVLDEAESDALVECVRAFLLYRPSRRASASTCPGARTTTRSTWPRPRGWAEYRADHRPGRRAGLRRTRSSPRPTAAGLASSDNRDAWGWENLLFFSLGQKIRKGEWNPGPRPGARRRSAENARLRPVARTSAPGLRLSLAAA